jgi:hypothetical protein
MKIWEGWEGWEGRGRFPREAAKRIQLGKWIKFILQLQSAVSKGSCIHTV